MVPKRTKEVQTRRIRDWLKLLNKAKEDCGTGLLPAEDPVARLIFLEDEQLCNAITFKGYNNTRQWRTSRPFLLGYHEALSRNLRCGVDAFRLDIDESNSLANESIQETADALVCNYATRTIGTTPNYQVAWSLNAASQKYVTEAKRRGLTCSIGQSKPTQIATNSPTVSGK